MIEAAENVLRDLGFYDVRVRHHELPGFASALGVQPSGGGNSSPKSSLARIEVGPGEMAKFLADGVASRVAESLRGIGYAHVTLDLQGYRRGSTNEALIQLAPTKARA